MLDRLRQEAEAQEDKLTLQMNDFRGQVAAQQAEVQKLCNEKVEYITVAEREMVKAKERQEELMGRIEDVIDQLNASKREEADRSRALQQDRISELTDQVAALTKEKEGIAERQRTLLERYRVGNLVSCHCRLAFPIAA